MENKLKVGDRVQLNDKHPNSGDISRNHLDGKEYTWPLEGAYGTIVKVDRAYYWVQFDEFPCGDDEGFPVHHTHLVNHPAPTDEIDRLLAENKRLRDALAWYADKDNYCESERWHDRDGIEYYVRVINFDADERARKALEGGE